MKSKWLFLLLWMCVIVRPEAWGQEVKSANTVAEEWIQVSSSSATVLQWFEWIEKSTGIVLSYNPAQMELGDVCRIEHGGKMTVETLVRRILSGYQMKIAVVPPRKLVIHARKIESYDVSGTVSEEDSEERLYGAVVTLEDKDGKQWNTISNGKGIFRLHVPEGTYTLKTSYMGYAPQSQSVRVTRDCFVRTCLKPLLFEIEEVIVESGKRENELGELTPSNLLAFSGGDLFSQIWILPGGTSSLAGQNFMVDGGGYDENQLLLDGVPVFHPGHFSSLLPVFNGDAVKNMVFHKGFFPTPLEGRISSVTEVNLKEGNKKEHVRTLTLDMPAASVMLEGPIIKNKLSYMVGARRNWLDFFDSLLSEENRLNHSTYDYNAKLSYNLSPVTMMNFLPYGARDDFHLPIEENGENVSVLRWDNQAYQLSFATQKGRLGNNVTTDFSYLLENLYHARWGVKYAYEVYDLVSQGEEMRVRHEPVNQVSIYYDNLLRISPEFSVQVGVHGVAYCPQHHRSYYSIQPRLSVKYFPSERNLLYLNFSKMEQFYHFLRFDSFSLPTDFRMPSIDSFKPRSSEHYEMGWKHFMDSG
ncbi:carboxypeptidase-like regulatory domain-containing protein [Phocaeicola plebeius]|uniref:TonB-dependent receptor n=2 Tax=Phocaeicola plebeius TaxID=310297 RepID=UPI002941CAEA|nr:carboxypeptidase-like regulatory domain-containing protein [Phocaeicola plebeius]